MQRENVEMSRKRNASTMTASTSTSNTNNKAGGIAATTTTNVAVVTTTATIQQHPQAQQQQQHDIVVSDAQLRLNARTQQEIFGQVERRYCEADLIYGLQARDGALLASMTSAIASIVRARVARYRQIFVTLPATSRTVPDTDLDKLDALLGRLLGERPGSLDVAPPNDPWARTAKQALFWIAFGLEWSIRRKLVPRLTLEQGLGSGAAGASNDAAAAADMANERRPRVEPIAARIFLRNDFRSLLNRLMRATGRTPPDITAFVRDCFALYVGYLPPMVPEYRDAARRQRQREAAAAAAAAAQRKRDAADDDY